jgi:hypothetical protein
VTTDHRENEMSAKRTPYWHPHFPTPDGRTSIAAERGDIASLLRDARNERRVYRSQTCHGARVYVLHPFSGAPYESGRVFMTKNFGSAA